MVTTILLAHLTKRYMPQYLAQNQSDAMLINNEITYKRSSQIKPKVSFRQTNV